MGKAIICGSCVVDLPCLNVRLGSTIGRDQTLPIDPIELSSGGITCNTGIALQRLGVSSQALTLTGADVWGQYIRQTLVDAGVGTDLLCTHPHAPTTAVVVLIDEDGSRSFLAPAVKTATKFLDANFVRAQRTHLEEADYCILGYYGRMPLLEPELPSLLAEIQGYGCRTAMDSASDGGDPVRLSKILPYLDIYVPSQVEASQQTKLRDPAKMIEWFRQYNDYGILGVKLGERGAILHTPEDGFIIVSACPPSTPIVDTTGAGDCFMAGLIAGLDRGLTAKEAGKWAAAAGALAITARGGHQGVTSVAKLQSLL